MTNECLSIGPWFQAKYIKSQYRNGNVAVRKIVYVNNSTHSVILFDVVPPHGRWTETMTVDEAIKHLVAKRDKNNNIIYCNERESTEASYNQSYALTR